MRAGLLRHQVTIQTRTDIRDGKGTAVETWSDVTTVWGSIEPLQGKEYYDAHRENADITHRARIRYRPGVTRENRLLYGSRIFDIEAVLNPDERNRELTLLCREVA